MAETTADAHSAGGDDATRRDFIFIAAGAVGGVGAVATLWPLVDQMNPASDTLALASTEYDLTQVVEGQQVVILWRGLPVFIRHRTPTEISHAVRDDAAPMKDPATDAQRIAQADGKPGKPEFLIVQANCTHLGCVPTFGGGDFGGWLCACHGSVYDTAARIRKGPAPLNLLKAPYVFQSDTVVKIG
ncbi:MAG: ubiquinol-cytochrome c reductase iron-sulfur subunit [Hyphomonadaceae bacterium]